MWLMQDVWNVHHNLMMQDPCTSWSTDTLIFKYQHQTQHPNLIQHQFNVCDDNMKD